MIINGCTGRLSLRRGPRRIPERVGAKRRTPAPCRNQGAGTAS